MGNIREYENPIQGLQPQDRGQVATAIAAGKTEQAWNSMGREIGGAVSQAGQAYGQYRAQEEISHGISSASEIQNNATLAWDAALKNADPNDPTTAQKFRDEKLNPLVDEWVQSFDTKEGRLWAEQHANQVKQHFFEKTTADQASMAGMAVVENLQSFTTNTSNMVMNDPTSLPIAYSTIDTYIETLVKGNPAVTPIMAEKIRTELRENLRKEIGKSAFVGMARANPDAAMKAVAEGGWGSAEFDGTERNQLYGLAQDYKRSQDADARAAVAAQRQAEREDFDKQAATITAQLFRPDGSVAVPKGFNQALVELSRHPGVDAGRIAALGNAAAQATQDGINGTYQRTDNSTWHDLAGRIGRDPTSTDALTHTMVDKAYAAGKLSKTDWSFLNSAVESPKADPAANQAMSELNKGLERLKPLITKSNIYAGTIDRTGDSRYNDLYYDAMDKFRGLVAGGKSPAEAVDILLDPRRPDGLRQNLTPYVQTTKEGLQSMLSFIKPGGGTAGIPAAAAPGGGRKPGESPEAYLKRTGG